MYSTKVCPYCSRAEKLLNKYGVTDINKIFVDSQEGAKEEMIKLTNRRTVPQIFIGDVHVGGFDDLSKLEKDGKLKVMLGIA